MNCLLIHETKFLKYKGKLYHHNISSDLMQERYIGNFTSITFLARIINANSEIEIKGKKQFESKSISIIPLENNSNLYLLFNSKNLGSYLKELILKYDCTIVRLPSVIGNRAVSIAKKMGKPCFAEVIGCPFDTLWNYNIFGKVLAIPQMLWMKNAVKHCQYVLYVTQMFLQKRYPTNGKSIGCSDVKLLSGGDGVLKCRLDKITNYDKKRPVILGTIAALNVKYKGQEYVIRAISELNKSGYNFEYHLVGGGDISRLKFIAENYDVADKIKFLGSLPHDKVFDYLDNVDIYMQPSKTEGLPRALIEAMSRGCPCLGSNIGGIPELIEKDFVFKAGSINSIIEKIKFLYKSKDLMRYQAEVNFNKSKEYSYEALSEKRDTFYKNFAETISL